jgi:hypothetical protein
LFWVPKGRFVYNLNLLRQLCSDLSQERDPEKFAELASLLHAVIKEDQEEVRLRISLLAKMRPAFAEFSPE